MQTATMEDVQARLPQILEHLNPGDEMVITRDGKPVAKLVPGPPWGTPIADHGKAIPVIHSEDAATEEDVCEKWLRRLASFGKLAAGWNSYSAPAPSALAIDNARALVTIAFECGLAPERVEPSAMGGVGVTFGADFQEVVAEFYNNGTAHALFANDATREMNTRGIRTDAFGYGELINEVRKYLYG